MEENQVRSSTPKAKLSFSKAEKDEILSDIDFCLNLLREEMRDLNVQQQGDDNKNLPSPR